LVHGSRNDGTIGFRLRIRVIWKEDIMKGHQEKLSNSCNAITCACSFS
jgi:hypothetical protein